MSIPSQETISIQTILENTEIHYDRVSKTYYFLSIPTFMRHPTDLSYQFSSINLAYIPEANQFVKERNTLASLYGGFPREGKWPFYFKNKEDVLLFVKACIELGYVG